jgi:excisionase family DNA binding protein
MIERLLSARALADLLGFSPATIQDWYEAGTLPGFRIGGRLRFRASEVNAWLEERRQTPRHEPSKVLGSGLRD